MSVEIRKMRKDDLQRALALLAAWNMAPRPPTAEIPDPERASLNIDNSFVALHDGKLVGVASYIVLDKETAETASLAVAKTCQGLGVGYLLQKARL
ncbi:MAG: GNAT family N-acetyltransferase [Nitrosomonadales bacterium]|nr:GNAT family N-acetyltransferase [Nitrosomonadales bacterium]